MPDLSVDTDLPITTSPDRQFPRPLGGTRAGWAAVRWPARRSRRLFLLCLIVVGMSLAVCTGTLVMYLHRHALDQAEQRLQSLSLVLADQAERAFEAVELVQTALVERVQSAGVRSPAEFRNHMAGEAMFEDLRGRIKSLPQLDAITAIDSEGNLLNFSRYWPTPRVNVADRDYFKALSDNSKRTVFIGQPVPNRGSGTWTIYIARKITGSDGTFIGMVLGAIELAYFERLYESVLPDSDSSIGLFRRDGAQLARFPHIDRNIGKSFAGNMMFSAFDTSSEPGVSLQFRGRRNDTDRLMAAHRLKIYPLVVSVSTSLDAILRSWRREAAAMIGGTIVLELLLAAAGMMIVRELRSQSLLDAAQLGLAEAESARRQSEAALLLAEERERADREISNQHVRFGVALNNMTQALCMFDKADRLVVANERLAEMFGLPLMQVKPMVSLQSLLGWSMALNMLSRDDSETIFVNLDQMKFNAVRAAATLELTDGRALAINFEPVEAQGWLVTLDDITDRRLADAKIVHMAHHDALTGLPNRVLFHQRLAEAVARGRRGDSCAVLCLDLDHFKAVNDTLGHPVGDALLQEVTRRLLAHVRDTDTVARLGGDEFAIVQASVDQPTEATALATRLINALSVPYELLGHQMVIGTSVGISVAPHDGDTPASLLKNADMALYRAKADGRGRYRFFEPQMDALMQARRVLELDLRKALIAREFMLYYQPLINVKTRQVSAFEALLRWNHPTRGLLPPNDFVPLAEEIGLILPLGEWVLHRACRDAMTWPGDAKVAVNLSAVQFGSRTLVQNVVSALASSGLPPERLELEITETVMIADTEGTIDILHQLHALGVTIAMDDFGTGYSSLSYLRRFPFDKVKIDKSFIEGLGQGGDCDAIVGAVTGLCGQLGMTTTAEGVETERQLQHLSAGNCTEVQGYLFSRPRPADEVAEVYALLNQLPDLDATLTIMPMVPSVTTLEHHPTDLAHQEG
jgi:diguanylate cyclase (GGDEF)-like protein